jgi:hypothetical protein
VAEQVNGPPVGAIAQHPPQRSGVANEGVHAGPGSTPRAGAEAALVVGDDIETGRRQVRRECIEAGAVLGEAVQRDHARPGLALAVPAHHRQPLAIGGDVDLVGQSRLRRGHRGASPAEQRQCHGEPARPSDRSAAPHRRRSPARRA